VSGTAAVVPTSAGLETRVDGAGRVERVDPADHEREQLRRRTVAVAARHLRIGVAEIPDRARAHVPRGEVAARPQRRVDVVDVALLNASAKDSHGGLRGHAHGSARRREGGRRWRGAARISGRTRSNRRMTRGLGAGR